MMGLYTGSDDADDYTGTASGDQAWGNGGDDTLRGAAGDDLIAGGNGDDALAGDAGADTLDGGEGRDTLYAGAVSTAFDLPFRDFPYTAPILDTGRDADILRGGAGDDQIFAGYGDTVDGGNGNDQLLISFMGANAGIKVTFKYLFDSISVGGATISSIESVLWVEGSAFGDKITMSEAAYMAPVFGRGGDDYLILGFSAGSAFGGEGNDTIDGGGAAYAPPLYGEVGDDTILRGSVAFGGDGNDRLYGRIGSSRLAGESGDDTIHGAGSDDTLSGGDGNDLIYGAAGIDGIDGGNGDDVLWGEDTTPGGVTAGDSSRLYDILAGGAGADVIHGESGDDAIWSGLSLTAQDEIYGGQDDIGTERDRVFGDDGNDRISVGFGDDADGGAGQDALTLVLTGASSGLVVAIDRLRSSDPYLLGGGTIRNFERLVQVTGTAFDDRFEFGRAVTGEFDGAGGNDTLSFAGASEAVTVELALRPDGPGNGPGGITISGFENVVGGGHDDVLGGSDGANGLAGGTGNDRLTGFDGNDTIDGGAGNDLLEGGGGADALIGGDGIDTASYAAAVAGVAVNLGLTTPQSTGGAGIDTIQGVENLTGSDFADTLTGSTGRNILSGGIGADQLFGGKGTDTLDGGAGDDLLVGGLGDDVLIGGIGIDIASYRDAIAGVTVNLAIATAQDTGGAGIDRLSEIEGLRGSAFNDVLRGDAAANIIDAAEGADLVWGYDGNDRIAGGLGRDKLYGGNGNDRLDGNEDNDVLAGGAGKDLLDGGSGDDVVQGEAGSDALTGGAGADRFVYVALADSTSLATGRDQIRDFSHTEGDRIDLSAIDAVTGGGNDAFAFIGSDAFSGIAGQLNVVKAGADWLVQGDVDGDKLADFAIQVTSATVLVAGDFVL